MSYEPHTWTTGETITAAKLNALEQGVASGGGGGSKIIHNATYNWDDYAWEIEDAELIIDELDGGATVIIYMDDSYYLQVIGYTSSSIMIYSPPAYGFEEIQLSGGGGGT